MSLGGELVGMVLDMDLELGLYLRRARVHKDPQLPPMYLVLLLPSRQAAKKQASTTLTLTLTPTTMTT